MSPYFYLFASALASARWSHSDPWIVTTGWNRGFTVACLGLCEVLILAAHFAFTTH